MRSPNQLLNRLSHPAWAMSAGILLGLSMPPFGFYALAWIALVPLLIRWSSLQHPMTIFREAYVTFLLMAIVAGFWVLLHSSITVGLLSGVGLLLLPVPHAVAFTLALLIRKRFGLLMGLLALVANVLAVEFLVGQGAFGFPWLLLGHTQADALLFNQHADIGGVALLTAGVLISNILGFAFVRTAYRPGPIPAWRSLIALSMLAMFSGAAAYGDLQTTSARETDRVIQIGWVQPAVKAKQWSDATDGSRVEALAALSDRLIGDHTETIVTAADSAEPRLDLLIWPEASLPVFEEKDRQGRLYARLSIWSRDRGLALLAGAVTDDEGGSAFYNAAMLFDGFTAPQAYEKNHMIPLAEVMPFLGSSPMLDAMTIPPVEHARMEFGHTREVLRTEDFAVGTTIGFESLHGDYVRTFVNDGADVLVSLAQNGWWSYPPNGVQFINLARLRAIETRRAVVVSTVSGTSGLVHPDGRVESVAGWMEEEIARREVPLRSGRTIFVRHGDWLGRASLLPSGGLLLLLGVSLVFFRRPSQPARKRAR